MRAKIRRNGRIVNVRRGYDPFGMPIYVDTSSAYPIWYARDEIQIRNKDKTLKL